MSYYLIDPYHYKPKCYPFLNTKWQPYSSNRITKIGKQIQQSSAITRLKFSHNISKQNQKCSSSLLKCKYMMDDLVEEIYNPINTNLKNKQDNFYRNATMAEIQTNRKVKQNNLRQCSRNLPLFINYRKSSSNVY